MTCTREQRQAASPVRRESGSVEQRGELLRGETKRGVRGELLEGGAKIEEMRRDVYIVL